MSSAEGKTYLLDITGICVEEDEIENTTIHVCRNGEWCEIPWDKSDIVGTLSDGDSLSDGDFAQLEELKEHVEERVT